jgi:heme exporter protein A
MRRPERPAAGALLGAAGLECVRGERTLFSGLSLELHGGELLRVAGANGSGKTSLLRMLCGLLEPDEGEVRWRGEPIGALREDFWRELVYIGHANALKDDLTAVENLVVARALQGARLGEARALEALADLGLERSARLPARALSQGQRRRVALARLALSESQPLWILDEPFSALDAAAVEQVRATLAAHLARGGMLLYSTHQDVAIEARASRRIDLGTGAR